ncbi:MAG: hypothetical protein HY695_06955 [Deltaproteobacteria bacterium]|nr:hypothetical protein [Deltaproteobacteria bacterium]
MRLDMAEFPVTKISLGRDFGYHSGALEVDGEKLRASVLEDDRIKDASVEVVVPGQRIRITGVRDVVEPRVKVQGQGQVFPGIMGPVVGVGDGRTHRLSGMAVVVAAEYEGMIRSGSAVQRSAILDMWGPGAEVSHFSSLLNLVLIVRLAEGLPEIEAHTAIQRAEYTAARRLAEATMEVEPQAVQTYELTQTDRSLPRVVLIQGCLTDSHHPHSGLSYYGLPLRDSLATVVHPNEFLDGAVTGDTTRAMAPFPTTWDWQNHPLLLGLYREHGRRLNFAGVILERIRFETHQGKEVIAHNTAQLAATLGANDALLTWNFGGNCFVDLMLTLQACEKRGIKTVLVTHELAGKDGIDAPLLYFLPEANAVVSTGSRERWMELPAPEKIVGPYEQIQILSPSGTRVVPARGDLSLDSRDKIIGGVDLWGRQSWTCSAY